MFWILGVLGVLALVIPCLVRGVAYQLTPPTFSDEYRRYIGSAAWRRRRRRCLALSLGRDCVFPWLPATDVDHLTYRNLGHELPFFDIVPLNWRTHRFVTAARPFFGRALVNMVLRLFFALWFTPYIAFLVLLFTVAFPTLAHSAFHNTIAFILRVGTVHV